MNGNHDIYTNNHNSRKTERKEIKKNTLQVAKLNEPPARKTTERYHLSKKNSLTNQLEAIVFKRNEVGTLRNALFLEKILYKGLKSHVGSENKQNIRLRCVTFAIKQIIK